MLLICISYFSTKVTDIIFTSCYNQILFDILFVIIFTTAVVIFLTSCVLHVTFEFRTDARPRCFVSDKNISRVRSNIQELQTQIFTSKNRRWRSSPKSKFLTQFKIRLLSVCNSLPQSHNRNLQDKNISQRERDKKINCVLLKL